jgi:peroxin-6
VLNTIGKFIINAAIAELNRLSEPCGHPHPLTPQYYLAVLASAEDIDVLVSQLDFDMALGDLIPSVSQSEMDHYRDIQRRFSRDALEMPSPQGHNIR